MSPRPRRRVTGLLLALALLGAACSDEADPDPGLDQRITDPAEGSAVDRSGSLPGGATWRVVAPEDWNGTLLLFSHGTVPRGRANPARVAPNEETTAALLARGYALAGSSFAHAGWAVDVAVPDQVAALEAAVEALRTEPTRTIAWGASLGGLVTVGLVEGHADLFDGGLSLCGIVGGSTLTWDTLLDVGVALQRLLAPQLPIVDFTDDGSTGLRLLQAVGQQAQATAPGRARLALASALGAIPGWATVGAPRPAATDPGAQQLAQLANLAVVAPLITQLRADIERQVSGNPSSNVGVDYRRLLDASGMRPEVAALYGTAGLDLDADLAALQAAPRVTADAEAREDLEDAIEPTGELEDPFLVVHTTGDGVVPVGHVAAYTALADDAGSGELVRSSSVDRAGHCSFTVAEQVAALEELAERIDTGAWPSDVAAALGARAGELPLDLQVVGTLRQQPAFTDAPPAPLPRLAAAP
jgi:hypothetical protein